MPRLRLRRWTPRLHLPTKTRPHVKNQPMTTTPNTQYNGHLPQSRQETPRAALFDLIGRQYTYEPLNANKYPPDLLTHGPNPSLTEAKPNDNPEKLKKYVPKIDATHEG